MKSCTECINYRQLVNQGIWWCELQNDMNPETCKDYDAKGKAFIKIASTICKQMSSADKEAASLIEKVCEQQNKDFNDIINDIL